MSTSEAASAAQLPSDKLELEIRKLTGELQHQSTQTQLTIDKLRLEADKLQLDMRELKRSPWLRPGTIIPLAATVGTILFAQFQGVFDVAQRRLELSHLQLKIDSSNLTAANEQLREKRAVIDSDIRKLAADRQQLQDTLQGLQRDKTMLEARVSSAALQLDTMGRRLRQAQIQAQYADEKARTSYPAFRGHVLSDIYARVKSSCREHTTSLYVDDRAAPGQWEVRERPAESPVLKRPRSECIRQMVESIPSTTQLEPKDREALAENVRLLASQIEEIRLEAMAVYADDTNMSGPWTLNLPLDAPLSSSFRDALNAKRATQPLPTTEPQRSHWVEWRRRYLVELHYLNRSNGLLGTDWLKLSGGP